MMLLPEVIVNATPLVSNLTGVGNYTNEILKEFFASNSFNVTLYPPIKSIVYNPESAAGHFSFFDSAKKRVFQNKFLRKSAKIALYLAAQTSKKIFDVYFEPNFIPAVPYNYKRSIITVHDFSFIKYAKWHPGSRVKYFKNFFWKGLEKTDAIITVSDYVRNEAINEYGIAKEKIRLIPNGVNHSIFKKFSPTERSEFIKKNALPQKFILFTGTLEPRKNVLNLIHAYNLLPQKIKKETGLLLVGGKGPLNPEIEKFLHSEENNIHCLGYVSQNYLVGLYNCAQCFVYIPWYEGFGLPPLEAMACGCPCIVSNVASLPEVCGKAALYVSPDNNEEIMSAIKDVLQTTGLQREYSETGIYQSNKFSWEKSAKLHKELIESIV